MQRMVLGLVKLIVCAFLALLLLAKLVRVLDARHATAESRRSMGNNTQRPPSTPCARCLGDSGPPVTVGRTLD